MSIRATRSCCRSWACPTWACSGPTRPPTWRRRRWSSWASPASKRITVYPANGQTGVPTTFNRCQEHPTPFGGACDTAHPVQNVGYVVTLQADGYNAMKIQGIGFSRGSSGSPVAIHRAVRYRTTKSTVAASSVDPNLPTNAAMLAATAPLAANTRYNVRVSGYVQATKGGKWVQFKTRTWSFTTA